MNTRLLSSSKLLRSLCQLNLRFPIRLKTTVDYSNLPKLNESDLEEQFVKGSGPGGSAVNKTVNCVTLKHTPTGLVVKCHQSRLLSENRDEARRMMITKLDKHFNGELSVADQKRNIGQKKIQENARRRRRSDEMKKQWQQNESDLLNK